MHRQPSNDSLSTCSAAVDSDSVILRAEVPHIGIRKAIRVCKNELVGDVVDMLLKKLHLSPTPSSSPSSVQRSPVDSLLSREGKEYRLFRPYSPLASHFGRIERDPLATPVSADGQWLENDRTLAEHGNWQHHDVIQLRFCSHSAYSLRRHASTGSHCWNPRPQRISRSAPSSPRTSFCGEENIDTSLTTSHLPSAPSTRSHRRVSSSQHLSPTCIPLPTREPLASLTSNDQDVYQNNIHRTSGNKTMFRKKGSDTMRRFGKMVAQKTTSLAAAAIQTPLTNVLGSSGSHVPSHSVKASPHFGHGSMSKRRSGKSKAGQAGQSAGRAFGVPLDLVDCCPDTGVPYVVEKLLMYLEQNGK
jgi:hypothetical protein